jgi:hypothetical protein
MAGGLPLTAGDFWQRRPFPDWTPEDVDRLLSDSPWAKQVTVRFDLPIPATNLASNFGDRFSDVGLPGGVGFPGGRPGRWPGSGSGQPGAPRTGGASSVRSEVFLTIRWSSALPVRQAIALDRWGRDRLDEPEARKFLSVPETDYVVEVFGIPAIVAHQGARRLEAELFDSARILVKGRAPIRTASAHVPVFGNHLAATLRFPRHQPIEPGDHSVEFLASGARMDIARKFKLESMTYEGRLEL